MNTLTFQRETYRQCGYGDMRNTRRYVSATGKIVDGHIAKVQSADSERIQVFDRDNPDLGFLRAPQLRSRPVTVGELVMVLPLRHDGKQFHALRTFRLPGHNSAHPKSPSPWRRHRGVITRVDAPRITLLCDKGREWKTHQAECVGVSLRPGTKVSFEVGPQHRAYRVEPIQ